MIERLAKQVFQDIQNALNGEETLDASKVKSLIEAALRKLNLVTREEFDAQAAVLARTREMLAQLEARLKDLEGKK